MHLLLLHNNYGAYSGEEAVVDRQLALFKQLGHRVSVYRKTTEGERGTFFGNIKGLFAGFYSPESVRDTKGMLKGSKPDLVVIHNLYPYISPAVLKPIKEAGIPIVMTVHNYRLMCPTGLFVRNEKPCELCLGGHEWNCIRHNCEQSLPKSIGYAGRNWYARVTKAYSDHVDIYACITQFQIQKLTEAGFESSRMRHIPNFLASIDKVQKPDVEGNYIAVSGRLSKEKGIDLILEVASKTPEINYVFAGLIRKEEKRAYQIPDNCTFSGHLSGEQLSGFYGNARFLLNASRCYEGFPMTLLEAASHHKPAIGPGHAGFLEIIDDQTTGLHFTPGSSTDLEAKIRQLWDDPISCRQMGENAFLKLREKYSQEVVKKEWKNLIQLLLP